LSPQNFDFFCKVLRGSIAFLGILDKLNRIFFTIKSVLYPIFQGRLFKKIEMKGFSIDDKNEAIEFLKNA
jgi:hypothetical protein